jgi:hypothetical protein
MRKVFILGGLLLTLASCQVAEPRASLPAPLPDNVTPVPYSQLLTRARTLATRATEALFVDNFADVEEAARGLEQTAKYLVKSEDVPAKHKDTLATMAGDLGKLAKDLRESASSKNAEKANEILGKINAKVRSMRLAD